MSNQQTIKDALATFYRAKNASKIKRSITRMVDCIGTQALEKRGVLLALIASTMLRKSGGLSKDAQMVLGPRHARLAYALGEQMLCTDDVGYIIQNITNIPEGDEIQVHIASFLYVYIGASLEATLKFCRILFTVIARQEECGKEMNQHEPEAGLVRHVETIVLEAVNAPATDECVQKRWLLNLIEAAAQNDTEAQLCMQSVAVVLGVTAHTESTDGRPKGLRYVSQSRLDQLCPDRAQQLRILARSGSSGPRLVVPDAYMEKVARVSDCMEHRERRDLEESERFLEWFQNHSQAIGQKFDERCREIQEMPRYGIRPMGFDSFLIDVSPLRSVGLTSFSFYPEGERFPDVKVMATVRKANCGPILCQYWLYLRDFELISFNDINRGWGSDPSPLQNILEYIMVHALHRIIVGKPQKNLDDVDVERQGPPRDTTPAHKMKVRPFIRRLRFGFQASEEARQLAFLHMGWILPEGMTFVRSHDRWLGLPTGKPTPLFQYTDMAIQESIE